MKEWIKKLPEWKSSLLGAARNSAISLPIRCIMASRLKKIPPQIIETDLCKASLLPLYWLCLLPLPFWAWSCCEKRKKTGLNSKFWRLPDWLCVFSIIVSVYIFVILLPNRVFNIGLASDKWGVRIALLQTFGLPGLMDTLLYCLTALFLRPEGDQKNIS